MAAELDKLIKKRGSLKGALTRFNAFLEKADNSKLFELKQRLEKLALLWGQFEEVQFEIEILDTLSKPDTHLNERESFENEYFRLHSLASEIISNSSKSGEVTSPEPSRNQFNSEIRPEPNIITHGTKLPALLLPSFHGDCKQWLGFKNGFNALINSDSSLSNCTKFHYLLSCLKDGSAKCLEALEVSDDNYLVAWEILEKRFANINIIKREHMRSLFEIPCIQKESHKILRKFHDDISQHLRALESLGDPTDQWDRPMVYLFVSKLDTKSKREWEEKVASVKENPSISDFKEFLSNRCRLLETLDVSFDTKTDFKPQTRKLSDSRIYAHVSTQPNCSLCKNSHHIYACKTFQEMSVDSRWKEIKKLNICSNCLRFGHTQKNCRSTQGCRYCGKKHNTWLHSPVNNSQSQTQIGTSNQIANFSHMNSRADNHISDTPDNSPSINIHCSEPQASDVLLSTAIIHVFDISGKIHDCRIIVDSGSQPNFISSKLCRSLQLPLQTVNAPVVGISQTATNIRSKTVAKIKSRVSNYSASLPFLVLDKITDKLPINYVDTSNFQIPEGIVLADPGYFAPSEIDMLLGASVFFDLLTFGQIRIRNFPIIQNTKLGWIISGQMPAPHQDTRKSHAMVCNLTTNLNSLEHQMEKFWRLEECTAVSPRFSREEEECETLFANTTSRDEKGRFCVTLPLKDNIFDLGYSYETALRRFHSLENKLSKNSDLKQRYIDFMDEYQVLGHMTLSSPPMDDEVHYYLPHHGVLKETSTTTKLRVVFDASCKTSSGISLNEKLKIGPSIQDDLFSILIRFRKHNYVLTADIEKMYRQVNVDPSQRNLQRILWRPSPEQPVQHFTLNTLTYGTASAAFLAIRCLHQVGIDCRISHPMASKAILKDFYVDDLLTGTDNIADAKKLRNELISLLDSACFPLRKFLSNRPEILSDLSDKRKDVSQLILDDKTTKTLGLIWNCESDSLQFTIDNQTQHFKITKRTILSIISRIFDPLGLAGPVVVKVKILLQKLWLCRIGWDDEVPEDIKRVWSNISKHMHFINDICIPRQAVCFRAAHIQMHCFSDASEQAFGVCIYLRSTDHSNNHFVNLLCAKSRVAPLKKVTLPRLELCGALLAAKLADKVTSAIDLKIEETFYWCDSTIVLSWIAGDSSQWKTFTANRVAEIHTLTKRQHWHYVNTIDNPADIISRGLEAEKLQQSNLWWHGPQWLAMDVASWPEQALESPRDLPETRKPIISAMSTSPRVSDIFTRFSSLTKLQHVVAWCLRFKRNARVNKTTRISGSLSVSELKEALNTLVKMVQRDEFSSELQALQQSECVTKKSKLRSLNPYLDSDGIIRVGGRLRHSSLKFTHKFPAVLPNNHPFTDLIVRYEHHKNLHTGTQATLAAIRFNYWPIHGRSTVRKVLRQCITCFKAKPIDFEHQMGELPESRVKPNRPFSIVGIDFAGPFLIKDGKIRNRKIIKCYMCVFVCFTTKAVHLELAGDLTTASFLNTLKRFIARRGLCSVIYSDNGTNFIGAKRELLEVYQLLGKTVKNSELSQFLSENLITWKLIPPRSPHFGGLWEAAVKSAKHHLRRILGNAHLTYESLYTVMTQVEAVLNSRPLTPLSNDPNDFSCLTPGHFLIGAALTCLPEHDIKDVQTSRLNHYQRLQQLTQHFWSRWSSEYLASLQQRTKWQVNKGIQPRIGTMVILKEDNLSPLHWKMGRIVQLFPGSDGVVRVVNIKTASGVVKRALTKVCFLPLDM